MFGCENEFLTIEQREGPGPDYSILVRGNADRVRRNTFDVRLPMMLIERVHWDYSDPKPCTDELSVMHRAALIGQSLVPQKAF